MFFDIHSHILPAVDDGAGDINESIELLEMMYNQGITDCLATPHFYPQEDSLESFLMRTGSAFASLKEAALEKELPNIYLGCEMLYYKGISNSYSIQQLCLNGSDFLLLELTDNCINQALFEDLENLQPNLGIIPIIAHIERYHKAKNYRKLLKLIKANNIPTQINASSVTNPAYNKVIKKLVKSGLVYVVATDAHSVKERPPMLSKALSIIGSEFGRSYRTRLIKNSVELYQKIVSESENNA